MGATIRWAYDAVDSTMLLQGVLFHTRRVLHQHLGGPFVSVIYDEVDLGVWVAGCNIGADDPFHDCLIFLVVLMHEALGEELDLPFGVLCIIVFLGTPTVESRPCDPLYILVGIAIVDKVLCDVLQFLVHIVPSGTM